MKYGLPNMALVDSQQLWPPTHAKPANVLTQMKVYQDPNPCSGAIGSWWILKGAESFLCMVVAPGRLLMLR